MPDLVACALGPAACRRGSTGSCSAGRPNSSTGRITGPLAASRRPVGDIFHTSGPADPAAGLIKRYGHDRRHMFPGRGRETPARAFLRGRQPPGVGVVACGRMGEQYRVRCGGEGAAIFGISQHPHTFISTGFTRMPMLDPTRAAGGGVDSSRSRHTEHARQRAVHPMRIRHRRTVRQGGA